MASAHQQVVVPFGVAEPQITELKHSDDLLQICCAIGFRSKDNEIDKFHVYEKGIECRGINLLMLFRVVVLGAWCLALPLVLVLMIVYMYVYLCVCVYVCTCMSVFICMYALCCRWRTTWWRGTYCTCLGVQMYATRYAPPRARLLPTSD